MLFGTKNRRDIVWQKDMEEIQMRITKWGKSVWTRIQTKGFQIVSILQTVEKSELEMNRWIFTSETSLYVTSTQETQFKRRKDSGPQFQTPGHHGTEVKQNSSSHGGQEAKREDAYASKF